MSKQQDRTKRTRPKVLVIDADRDHVREVASHLRENGFRVEACYSSHGALGRIRSELPDAVVLEVIMPGSSGFEIAARMQADRHLSGIPVSITTDIQDSGGENHDYFPRPLDVDAFVRALKEQTAVGG